jgi:hypothetical protein
MSAQLRKFVPPIVQAQVQFAVKFMITERGRNQNVRGAPRSGFGMINRVVVSHAAIPRKVAADQYCIGLLRGDPIHQPPPDLRVGGVRLLWIGEARVAINHQSGGCGNFTVRNPEKRLPRRC